MTEVATEQKRIVVVARPSLGRSLEATLHGAGYEVHRTPDGRDLLALAARLRPHLIVVALDLDWIEPFGVVGLLRSGEPSWRILLLGDAGFDPLGNATPNLPLTVDVPVLLATVDCLLDGDEYAREP